ncbi:hypothetical protein BO70DRAFT_316483 [Aspergillus heteromorphus CBS 117.55]|uniref:Rhodopsin domain-containing protein n=1 Tax=Aspergillus heteromorphus CBS 117.55 TaxID=1448321 RepID=A0A317W3A7_9EURO|nr:uncharacterized protein BO70DRAFT_316483 [Aspergillus heteromorphus CBS 117.55]PWY79737.1 hypothetical protein BO70DRAFT_316483 [Aspergillus heteromorphus CBS 117.55]
METARDIVERRTQLSRDAKDVAIVLSISLFLATLAMGFRLWVSRTRKQMLQASEYMALGSLILLYSYAVTTYLILTIGHGGYPASLTPDWRVSFAQKCIYYLKMADPVGLGLVKCSILMVLLRVFAASSKATRLTIQAILILCVCWSLMAPLVVLLDCLPLQYNWSLQHSAGHCINRNAAFSAISSIDAATNAAIILIPLSQAAGVKISRPEKLVLSGSLIMGLFIFAVAVIRTVAIARADYVRMHETGKMLPIWMTVEWAVAIIVASVPGLWPLVDCIAFRDPFRSADNELCERPAYDLSSHLLGRLRAPTLADCARTFTPTKGAAIETGSVHSSQSIIRGMGTTWAEASVQAQRPGSFLSLEPGEVRVQTEWSVERTSFVRTVQEKIDR